VQYSVGVNRILTAEVDLVHFVGGDVTGNIIRKSRGNKPTILEMGGSNVAVIMDSALDGATAADDIAKRIYDGFAPATGQRCTAPRMLCVEEGAEAVVEALGKLVASGDHHLGNPFSKGTKMGPLVDRGAHQKMVEAIALAQEVGAKVYGDMKTSPSEVPEALNENSFWVKPVVIDWGRADFSDAKTAERIKAVLGDEIFGPLVHVLPRIKGIDAAIATTNAYDTHGLAGAIFTNKDEDVERYAAGVSVTSITVNDGPKDRSPFGPHGHPGLQTIGGSHHFNLYASERVVALPKPKVTPLKPAA
jgi:acyl-CoA reductase-like NAD-dependent aldehyde dehydrogenase